PAIGDPTRCQGERAVDDGVEGEDPGQARAAPSELAEQRSEEDAERVLRAVGDEQDEEAAGDDDPAVEGRPPHLGIVASRPAYLAPEPARGRLCVSLRVGYQSRIDHDFAHERRV